MHFQLSDATIAFWWSVQKWKSSLVLLGAISTFGFVTHFLPYITIITKLRQIPILKQSKESENIIEFNLNPKRKKIVLPVANIEHRTKNTEHRTRKYREKMGVTNTEFNHNAPTTERKSSESFRFTTVWRELIKLLHEQVKFFEKIFIKFLKNFWKKKSKFEKNGNWWNNLVF